MSSKDGQGEEDTSAVYAATMDASSRLNGAGQRLRLARRRKPTIAQSQGFASPEWIGIKRPKFPSFRTVWPAHSYLFSGLFGASPENGNSLMDL